MVDTVAAMIHVYLHLPSVIDSSAVCQLVGCDEED